MRTKQAPAWCGLGRKPLKARQKPARRIRARQTQFFVTFLPSAGKNRRPRKKTGKSVAFSSH
ncbi:hypothetical protein [Rivihabitans pingtungensis]|jgi:hypothetical protein|uniref:hypothetical protein n=1 Tax=Rivihabitans pingtungensis TaxID=1054498 RepID=UPI00235518C8|nr:hypothetical protein [Rivihabitans pingtungensis]MCK6437199.1 hypothetical protein [Rivihabitans pingtungensis]